MSDRPYDVITFDCYGTLVDWEGGITCAFAEALRQLEKRRWVHAAQSHFHDIVPADELGVPVAWINRKAETAPADARPDREMRTMADLADWLT